MGILKDMKERVDFTEREITIRDFFLEHPEHVINMSSREVGDATYSSAAAVTRFCQKLGCKGFPDFKLKFVSCIYNSNDTGTYTDEKTKLIEKENSVTIMKKISDAQIRAIEQTRNDSSICQMARVAALVEKATYIDFYVYDINAHIANYACSQLFHCGKIANTYTCTNVQELNALISDETHLPILISHTGANGRLIAIAKTLKKRGNTVILITPSKKTILAQLCDEVLIAKATEELWVEFDEMWTVKFITSVKYLLDVLFGILFSSDYERNVSLNEEYEKQGEQSLWNLKSNSDIRRK